MASFPTRRLFALLTPSYFPDATGSLQCNTGPCSPIEVSSTPPWHRSGAIWHLGLLLMNFPAEQRTKAPESGNKVLVYLQFNHSTPNWQHLPLLLWPRGVISSNRAQSRILKNRARLFQKAEMKLQPPIHVSCPLLAIFSSTQMHNKVSSPLLMCRAFSSWVQGLFHTS